MCRSAHAGCFPSLNIPPLLLRTWAGVGTTHCVLQAGHPPVFQRPVAPQVMLVVRLVVPATLWWESVHWYVMTSLASTSVPLREKIN